MKFLVGMGLAIALSVATVGRADASTITGTITFGGTLNSATDLATTDSLDFNNPAVVTSTSGDFAALLFTLATFTDFTFDPFPGTGVIPLWFDGAYSFDLTSITSVTQNADGLLLKGQGTMHAPGKDDTPYRWSLSADSTDVVAFSATNAPIPAPEPATLSLLGLGLAGVAAARRRRSAKQ